MSTYDQRGQAYRAWSWDSQRRSVQRQENMIESIKRRNKPCQKEDALLWFIWGKRGGGGMMAPNRGPIPPDICIHKRETADTSIPETIGMSLKECVSQPRESGRPYYTCSLNPAESPMACDHMLYGGLSGNDSRFTPNCTFWQGNSDDEAVMRLDELRRAIQHGENSKEILAKFERLLRDIDPRRVTQEGGEAEK